MGSMIQRRPDVPELSPPSSPTIASPGKRRRISPRRNSSASRSACVTKLSLPFSRVSTSRRKYLRVISPAARAASAPKSSSSLNSSPIRLRSPAPVRQFARERFERQAALDHEDDEVVDEVGRLRGERAHVFVLRRDDGLGRFLADLLENLVQPLLEEVGRVRAFGHLPLPPFDDAVKPFEHVADAGCVIFTLGPTRSEEHTSELQSHSDLVCRLLLEKKNHEIDHPTQGEPKLSAIPAGH